MAWRILPKRQPRESEKKCEKAVGKCEKAVGTKLKLPYPIDLSDSEL